MGGLPPGGAPDGSAHDGSSEHPRIHLGLEQLRMASSGPEHPAEIPDHARYRLPVRSQRHGCARPRRRHYGLAHPCDRGLHDFAKADPRLDGRRREGVRSEASPTPVQPWTTDRRRACSVKFVTARTAHGNRRGVLDNTGNIALLSSESTPDLESLPRQGEEALKASEERLPSDTTSLAAPVRPGKIICVVDNYAEHVRESNAPRPQELILFLKARDTVIGPHHTVLIPRGSEATDWEVELGVVIGSEVSYLEDGTTVLDHVGGYVLANDVSERHFQLERGGTWDKEIGRAHV